MVPAPQISKYCFGTGSPKCRQRRKQLPPINGKHPAMNRWESLQSSKSLPWEVDSPSAGQDITNFIWNSKILYYVQTGLQMTANIIKIDRVHTILPYLRYTLTLSSSQPFYNEEIVRATGGNYWWKGNNIAW
jgi:hypothetical protein